MKHRYIEVTGCINGNKLVIFRSNQRKAKLFLKSLQNQNNFTSLSTREVITSMSLKIGLVFDKAGTSC